MATGSTSGSPRRLARAQFGALIDLLRADGYRVIGPTVRGGAIVHDEIERVEDLPIGWTDAQEGGTYRLRRRGDEALFGYAAPAQSFRPHFFQPRTPLVRIRRRDGGDFEPVAAERNEPPRLALLGARACDVAGLAIQDLIFTGGPYPDGDYGARRRDALIIAVHCGNPTGTCFCVSMGTGPRASRFDVALTELMGDGEHRFLFEIGSDAGAQIADRLGCEPATASDVAAAEAVVTGAAARMGRTFDNTDIRGLLYRNLEHPRWDEVSSRCLTCTNCTLVCPTCFCNTIEDTTNLTGTEAERVRRWDSCFTLGHSQVHGGSVRASARSRYRQWLVHKVASWIDQFGMSGCVGCGRCITWCPVGIDITEEVAAIRASDGAVRTGT